MNEALGEAPEQQARIDAPEAFAVQFRACQRALCRRSKWPLTQTRIDGISRVESGFMHSLVRRQKMPLQLNPLDDLLFKLRQQNAPDSHLSRLTELVGLAQREPALQAIFLVGSYARGTGDRRIRHVCSAD